MGSHIVGVEEINKNLQEEEEEGKIWQNLKEMAMKEEEECEMWKNLKEMAMKEEEECEMWKNLKEMVAGAGIKFIPLSSSWGRSNTVSASGPSVKFPDADLHKAVKGFIEAKAVMHVAGVNTIADLPGLVSSVLLLSKQLVGEPIPLHELLNKILPDYKEALARLKFAGASWIQFNELMLVKDLKAHELEAFAKAYSQLKPYLAGFNVLVETYDGDVSPAAFKILTALQGVTAFGFDLVSGPKNLDLIKKRFPLGKKLFAGVVDGRSIRPTDLPAALNILHSLEDVVGKGNVVVSTSCPFYYDAVNNVTDPVLVKEMESSWLAIVAQKVSEVNTLANLLSGDEDEVRRNAGREQQKKLFEFDQRLIETAEELESHGDRLNMVEAQVSRALGMQGGYNAAYKARNFNVMKWLLATIILFMIVVVILNL